MTRIGLIGAGRWGRNAARTVSKALRTVVSDEGGRMTRTEPIAELAWVCDADGKAASEVAALYGVDAYDDLDEVLGTMGGRSLPDATRAEACWVATPIPTHELLVHRLLGEGLHVLCEKPLSRTKAQAEDLAAAADRRGLVLMADHTWRAHLGASILINKSAGHYSAQRWAKDARGFDALEDLLPHDIALSSWMYGTQASAVRVDGGLVVLRYNIAAGERFASMSYDYDNDEKRRRLVTDRGENNGELPEGSPEPLSVILDEFIASIREHRQPRIGGAAEFIHVAAVIEAAKESRAAGGVWVNV